MAQINFSAERQKHMTKAELKNAQAIIDDAAKKTTDPALRKKWMAAKQELQATAKKIDSAYSKAVEMGVDFKGKKADVLTLAEIGAEVEKQKGKTFNEDALGLQDLELSNSLGDRAHAFLTDPQSSGNVSKMLMGFGLAELALSAMGAGGVFGATGSILSSALPLIGNGISAMFACSPLGATVLAIGVIKAVAPYFKKFMAKVNQQEARDLEARLSSQGREGSSSNDLFVDMETEPVGPSTPTGTGSDKGPSKKGGNDRGGNDRGGNDRGGNGGSGNGGSTGKKDPKPEPSREDRIKGLADQYPKKLRDGNEFPQDVREGLAEASIDYADTQKAIIAKQKEILEFMDSEYIAETDTFGIGVKQGENGQENRSSEEIKAAREAFMAKYAKLQEELQELQTQLKGHEQELDALAHGWDHTIQGEQIQQIIQNLYDSTQENVAAIDQNFEAIRAKLQQYEEEYEAALADALEEEALSNEDGLDSTGGDDTTGDDKKKPVTAVVPVGKQPGKDGTGTAVITTDNPEKPVVKTGEEHDLDNGGAEYNPASPIPHNGTQYYIDENDPQFQTPEALESYIKWAGKKLESVMEALKNDPSNPKLQEDSLKYRQMIASAKELLAKKKGAQAPEKPGTEVEGPDSDGIAGLLPAGQSPESKAKLAEAYKRFQNMLGSKTQYKKPDMGAGQKGVGFGFVNANSQTGEERKYTVIDEMGLDEADHAAMYELLDAAMEAMSPEKGKQVKGAQMVAQAEQDSRLAKAAQEIEGRLGPQ